MTGNLAFIPTRSRRQAMDWSLVLLSQGIESTITEAAGSPGCHLVVAQADYEAAIRAIQQYVEENRGWPWQQPLAWAGTLFDWCSLGWVGLLLVFYRLSLEPGSGLKAAGMMDSAAVRAGEWWRLSTAILLHGDVGHLATNLVAGGLLLGLALGRFGTGLGSLAAFLAGVGGNLVALLVHPVGHRSLGASGMILGALGLLAAQSLTGLGQSPVRLKPMLASLAGGVMVFTLLGLSPGTDIVAHLGGFVTGLVVGMGLARLPRGLIRNPFLNLTAGALLGVGIILTWRLALRASSPG